MTSDIKKNGMSAKVRMFLKLAGASKYTVKCCIKQVKFVTVELPAELQDEDLIYAALDAAIFKSQILEQIEPDDYEMELFWSETKGEHSDLHAFQVLGAVRGEEILDDNEIDELMRKASD